jgi:hypothetical protein
VVQIVIDPDRCPQSNHPHGGVALGLSSQRSRTDPSIASSPISSIIAADESVPVYAAAGYDYPGEDLDALPAEPGVVRVVEGHEPDDLAADGTLLSFRTCG